MTSENPDPLGSGGGAPPRTAEDWLQALGEATAFFTCLRLGARAPRFRAADTLPVWPVLGLAIGLAAGVDLAIARWLGAAPWLAAVVGLLTAVVLTGALHEDGLADTLDAFGASGTDRARRLEILRDSRIGTFGALAIGFSLLFRAAALAQIVSVAGTKAGLLALAATHALSRATLAWPVNASRPARSDGLGAALGTPDAALSSWTLAIGSALAFLCLLGVAPLAALLAPPLVVALAAGATSVARESLGGYTGDTLGATQQLAEIAVLVLAALCAGGG
ncbi:MAG: adenosylcobinamide-GDP ribazoletransferase [Alphaproteobacteria bacterium]|nr:adenosylcobinamide-GDP ribazoletransferase [Alphaproteobacteria bacterium]